MTTISNFVAELKANLKKREAAAMRWDDSPFLEYGFRGSDVTAGDPVEIDWDALNKAIDEFCAEFKARNRT